MTDESNGESGSNHPDRKRESGVRIAIASLISAVALAYAAAVVVVAYKAPDKGFLAFTGRTIIDVEPGGPGERAGIEVGDIVVGIDGQPIISTADYIDRLLRRSPGETATLDLKREGLSAPVHVELTLGHSPVPMPAIAATILAAMLLLLGLIARYGRPDDVAARRFWRTTVVYAMVYAGALSWVHLLVHPVLAVCFFTALFLAMPLAVDFHLIFPAPPKVPRTKTRIATYTTATILLVGIIVSMFVAVKDFQAGVSGDRGLQWAVRCVALLLFLVLISNGIGLFDQFRRSRDVTGSERAQLKWLLFGFTASALPTFVAAPIAAADLPHFLLVGYRPYVVAIAILWFAANALAVLRIRLADVDSVIHRSLVYAGASGVAVAVYVAVVLTVGVAAEKLVGGSTIVPHIIAALTAAALFGPIRGRFTRWLDRRFFRDRVHYLAALGGLMGTAARLREPPDLAREVVDRATSALRASSGALYLADDSWKSEQASRSLVLAHHSGGNFKPTLDRDGATTAPKDGIAFRIGSGDRTDGALIFGPRLDGDLYSTEDRNLLSALASQLVVAFENARAYGTIAELGRTLEKQNSEIRELRDRLEDENLYLRRRLRSDSGDKLVGTSKALRALKSQVEKAAPSMANILLIGESGTGKGLIARTVHASSDRNDNAFIHVDCGAIPAGVFESELFGHERGAFTGAVRKRRGHFELADGGTLFLDEIGELPLDLQPKLLRALQERSFLRVGGSEQVTVDVRIIAATNRNLEEMVSNGTFREDLYYRLRVVEIETPPLRSRRADLPALVDLILPRLCKRNHRPRLHLSEDAMSRIKEYGWPGNVRELENVLERAVVLSEGREIGADDLSLADQPPSADEMFARAKLDIDENAPHDKVMEAIEKKRLELALRAAGGNQSSAARKLGMARTTFINKLRRYDML